MPALPNVLPPPSHQAVVTDHVIIRGRFSALELRLIGRMEHSPASARSIHAAAAAAAAGDGEGDGDGGSPPAVAPPRLFEGVRLPLGQASLLLPPPPAAASPAAAPPPPPPPPPGLAGPLPLPGMPQFFVHAVQQAVDYYSVVQRSHKRICTSPPFGRLVPLMEVADVICDALQGVQGAGVIKPVRRVLYLFGCISQNMPACPRAPPYASMVPAETPGFPLPLSHLVCLSPHFQVSRGV